ncbi:ubiquitin carboxyl-terminal hydrolase 16 [Embiotoca jacksoni]|uniref:ubiquitin carboxyl-terminal hydrolase 16 n=1 Tax=Embiotoca jacksoni TaxID=100190 RepID=UPI003703B790
MGKKRVKEKSPREDDDIDQTGPSCKHIKKGTDQTLLKKLSGNSDWTSCSDCQHGENKENISTALPQDSDLELETGGTWMCLKCGHRGCGRNSENQHAIKHYETPRSDPHCLVVSLDNWAVWCYICDDEVRYSRTGHLAQLVANLKKQNSEDPLNRPQKRVKEETDLLEADQKTETVKAEESEDKENKENREHQKKNTKKESVAKLQKYNATAETCGISVKGLSNLGNTCFFNAVIQNLSQTQLLRQTLNKVTAEKNSLDIKPGASSDLEPIVVQLDPPGSLTLAMCQLLNEIQECKKSVVTPRELFSQVCKKAARFKGFQQQDSQELLRYLLDGMRAEEFKRVTSGMMESLKQSRKETDGEQLKTLIKEYEKNGFPKNFVDQVFGGEMTSTIMCQQCKTVSVVTEMFLDLSLPVSDEAYRKKNPKKGVQKTSESRQDDRISPSVTSGNDEIPTGAGSKYQQKKAKKQAKKQAKHQKRQQKFEGRVTLDSLTSPSHTDSDQTAEAQDQENTDNETQKEASPSEQNPAAVSASEQEQQEQLDQQEQQDQQDQQEQQEQQDQQDQQDQQEQDLVQVEQEKEEDEDSVIDCDSSATSSVSNHFTVLSEGQHSTDSNLCDEISNMDQEREEDTQLVSEMEKVTLNDAFIEDTDAVEQIVESDEVPEAKEYTVVNQDPALAFHTLAARTTPEKQECSVQSCLFQFTEVETLTQNNSLLCVTCTKQQLKKDKAGGSKKNIYTDALKQMLISSPPPVLTLHLKRFQQNGYSICKVNRHVHFPLILDLASFCAVKCKNMTEGGPQILYSLYGIVEHSGTMRSGHYTAYVKVRAESPKPSSNGLSAEGDAEPPRGSWFHISDTSVQPVSENKVQSCQAYLLFYERIL